LVSLEDKAEGLASENNRSDSFQLVFGVADQIEEIWLVLYQYGDVSFISNSQDNKVKGKQMKLRDKARLVNQKMGHPKIVQ